VAGALERGAVGAVLDRRSLDAGSPGFAWTVRIPHLFHRAALGRVVWLDTDTITGRGALQMDASVRGEDFRWPPAGIFSGRVRLRHHVQASDSREVVGVAGVDRQVVCPVCGGDHHVVCAGS